MDQQLSNREGEAPRRRVMENERKFQYSMSMKEGITEIAITGEVTYLDVENITNEMRNDAWKLNTRYALIDLRGLKGRFGIAATYFRVRSYPRDRPRIHTAIVDLAENKDYQSFHENTAFNAGLSLRWFTDIDEARAWLKSLQEGDNTPALDNN
jgi:hypothetical protein